MEESRFFQRKDQQSTTNKWRKMLMLLVFTGWIPIIHGELYYEGPQFTQEPSRYNYFTNVQGLFLHCGSNKGSPRPQIQWFSIDGQPLLSFSGIREIFTNGSIHFPPFPVSFYRPDVHDQTYFCVASNPVGKIRSRDVHVRAVINQRYEVHVEDAFSSEGSDTLFRCAIPDSVKDFVSVTSWTKDGSLNIFPHSGGGGRYWMTPGSGELLIEEVTRNDSTSTFRCRVVNRLTGETQLSENSGRLQLSGPGSKSKSAESPPSINSRLSKLKLKEGEVAVLLCLSDGSPTPTHWWLRSNGAFGGLESLRQTERIRIRKSAVIIENVGIHDAGFYACYANSSAGSDMHQIDLVVTSPLSVQLLPPTLTVDIGKSAEFTCWTNSPEEETTSRSSTGRQISWRKDGIEIRSSLRLSVSQPGDKLRIANVQREDKGCYQCFVKSDLDMVQSRAELRLGDSAPQLVYRFIEQSLRAGPAISLKCSATGNPTPIISYLLDGFSLPHSERLLIGQYVTLNGDVVSHVNITTTRVEDGGLWECTASSALGKVSHSARLNIYGPPFVRNMPTSLTAVAGKNFAIRCPVAGYPIHSITWEKDGQTLPLTRRQLVSPDGSLLVKDVDRNVDTGQYFCTATSKQGNSDKKGFQLNVVVPPKISAFSFPENAKDGEKIFATCVVSEGDHPIRMEWWKEGTLVGDSSSQPSPENKIRSKFSSDLTIHRIGDDALFLQITRVSSESSGNYTCLAKNTAAEVTYSAQLVVHVPPKISPFSFPQRVTQGSRVQVICNVEQADIEETNLSVTWKVPIGITTVTDGRTQTSSSTSSTTSSSNIVKVVHVDAYSTMLIIDRVDAGHSGNYTCSIANVVDEVSKTVPLIVHVPPKWLKEPPKEAEVAMGSPMSIPCQADGFPTPTVSWKKAMGNRPENYRDIRVQSLSEAHQPGGSLSVISSSDDTFSLGNGTLIIRSARKAHQGFYLCELSNGIGTGLSKVVRLVINVPVHIKEPQQNTSVRVGGIAILRCEVTGDGPILEVGWKRGLAELKQETDFRFQTRTLNNSQGTTFTEMTINNVAREDSARYTCFAANHHGRSQGSAWLLVQEPPDTPRNLHLISKGSRFVRLGWILTQDGNSPIIQFSVKYKMESGISNDFHEVTVPGSLFSETVGNLRPYRKYVFTVIAENGVGQSEESEALEIKTDGEAPEGRPRNLRVTPGKNDIQISWEHPDRETWHGELLGYYVGYVGFKRFREGEQYQFSTIERREYGLQEYQIKGVIPFSSYEIVVQAYNGIGSGPLSEAVVATTLEDAPASPPDGLHCSALTSHNLQLSWNALPQELARGLIKGYKVFLEKTADFDWLETIEPPLVRTTPSTNLIVSGLAKYTNYSVVIQAYTAAGDGPTSSFPTYCHTEEDLPGSPSAIKAVISSVSSVIVSWLPPQDPNGILTKYTVYISMPEGGGKNKDSIKRKRQVPPDVTKYQFDGLRHDEKYEFRVTASTSIGEGNHAISHKLLTRTVQSAIISFGTEFRIVWKTDVRLPCETVGNNPTTVQWTRYTENVRESDRIVGSQEGDLMIRNAKREDNGNFTCSITEHGHVIDSIMHRVVVQVPPLSPLLNAAVNSHSSVNLQWKLSDSGSAPIRGYILTFKAADEWLERQIPKHLNSYELFELECGTTYQMYLTAWNRAGMGRASQLVNVSTLGYSPSLSLVAPQFMVETNSTQARILLQDVWSGNGCPIRKFQVLFKEVDSSHWQAVASELTGESHSADLVGLKGGTSYAVKVIATNSAGSSQAEVTINTPSVHGIGAETSNKITNFSDAITPFYLDIKLMIPIILSSIAIVVAAGGICLCFRNKTPVEYRSTDHLSMGTSSSSTYFKQNQRNSQQQQVYMTVKKSTPMKGAVDVTDLDPIPQYADDIHPYATFELNENRTSIPTMDRRRSSSNNQQGQWANNQNILVYQQDNSRPNLKANKSRTPTKPEESEEYDSYGSDTDTAERDPIHPGANRSSIMPNHAAMPNSRLNSKFQDYDSHARHGNQNRYEFAPPTRQFAQNEIHGMVMADPYSFNDAFPTIEDDRRRNKAPNRRRSSQGHSIYETSEFSGPVVLKPPHGFKDQHESGFISKNKRKSANSSMENVINV